MTGQERKGQTVKQWTGEERIEYDVRGDILQVILRRGIECDVK